MIELDRKLLDLFQGFVVRKDIVRAVKVGANVPVFVLEYLLANSCSTDDEEKIKEGVENVKSVLQKHYVNPDESNVGLRRLKNPFAASVTVSPNSLKLRSALASILSWPASSPVSHVSANTL